MVSLVYIVDKIKSLHNHNRLWCLLNECFPRYELRTYQGQLDVFKLNEYNTRFFKKGKNILGLLAWWDFDWCIFLEYFCIKSKFRGMGYSNELFEFIFKMHKLVILEVDKTDLGLLNFYISHNFVLNDNFEYQPINLSKDYVNNNNLILMSYPRKISANEFENFVSELTNPKYNQYRK